MATVANDDSVHVTKLDELRQHLDPAESPRLDRIFAGMPAPIRLVRFDPTGSQLVTVAGDGLIRIWQLDTGKLLEAARRVAGRNLTCAEWKSISPASPTPGPSLTSLSPRSRGWPTLQKISASSQDWGNPVVNSVCRDSADVL